MPTKPKPHKLTKKRHLDFTDLSCLRKSEHGVQIDTGYQYEQVRYIWQKYYKRIISKTKELTNAFDAAPYTDHYLMGVCFYVALWYIHQYPTVRSIPGHRFGNYGHMLTSDFYRWVMPVLCGSALVIKEIFWADRLHPENHGTGLFAQRFTALIDCAPIDIQRPDDPVMENALFNGKAGEGHCWKIQIAINFLGWIVMYTGLHL